jgi:hypothetical protein
VRKGLGTWGTAASAAAESVRNPINATTKRLPLILSSGKLRNCVLGRSEEQAGTGLGA